MQTLSSRAQVTYSYGIVIGWAAHALTWEGSAAGLRRRAPSPVFPFLHANPGGVDLPPLPLPGRPSPGAACAATADHRGRCWPGCCGA